MTTKNFFAVDLGATSGRTILATYDGGRVEMKEITRFANPMIPLGGHLYWDIAGLYNEVLGGLRKVASEGRRSSSRKCLLAKGSPYRASLHTHPIELVAMTHCRKFMEKDVATRLLWSMIPETKAFCPRGLGMVPYLMPSGVELADATIKAIDDDYDVVMWEKHGVFAVDTDIMSAFDQVDVLNKAALIYIASKNMGFEPEGMSDAQMKELTDTFGLPK